MMINIIEIEKNERKNSFVHALLSRLLTLKLQDLTAKFGY